MSTLFEQLGGEGAISAVVDKFYVFMLADPSVAHFFESVNMAKQAVRQKQFITMVTGGPCNYEGKDMKAAHEKLPINKAHFDQTWHHLEQALTFYAVPQNLIQEVRNVFYSVETMIVNQVC